MDIMKYIQKWQYIVNSWKLCSDYY